MRVRDRVLGAFAGTALLTGLAVPGTGAQQEAFPSGRPEHSAMRSGLVADGDPPELFLIHTGDVIGYVDPCG